MPISNQNGRFDFSSSCPSADIRIRVAVFVVYSFEKAWLEMVFVVPALVVKVVADAGQSVTKALAVKHVHPSMSAVKPRKRTICWVFFCYRTRNTFFLFPWYRPLVTAEFRRKVLLLLLVLSALHHVAAFSVKLNKHVTENHIRFGVHLPAHRRTNLLGTILRSTAQGNPYEVRTGVFSRVLLLS